MKTFWKKANFKGHLLTAISYMIPIVCGAGFIIAIGMAFGGTSQDALVIGKFNFFEALATLGGKALDMLPVIIATGIAFSIAGKPGIAPGFVTGLAANAISAGFIGGMICGCVEGAILMSLTNGQGATVPFGGFLMLPTMGANWWVGLLAIAANVVVTGTVYALIKKDIPAEAMTAVRNSAEDEEDLDLDAIQVM